MPVQNVLRTMILVVFLSACGSVQSTQQRTPQDPAPLFIEPTAPVRRPTAPSSRSKVVFWTDDREPERLAVYRQVARRYMERNAFIDLEIIPVDESTLSERLELARQAGALPDLVRLGIEDVMVLGPSGLLDFAAANGVVQAVGEEDFRRVLLDMVTDPDSSQYMAIPYDGWIQALWYREDRLRALNLDVPQDWSSLRRTACTFTEEGDFAFGLVLPTDPEQPYVHQVFEQVAISNNAWPFDDRGRVTMNSETMREAIEWYTRLQECSMPGAQYWLGARDAYLNSRAGLFFYSTYIMDDLVEASSLPSDREEPSPLALRTGFAPILRGPNGAATYGQLMTLAILEDAEPASAAVARFFLEEGYQDILALAPLGKVPVLQSAVDEWMGSTTYFSSYPEETLEQIVAGYDSMQRWILRPDYTPEQRAIIGEIEARLLIPQALHAVAIEERLSASEAAILLQYQVEQLAAGLSPENR